MIDKFERLKEIFEENADKPLSDQGMVVAITGSWGIGKTYFWNAFIRDGFKQEESEIKKLYYQASRCEYNRAFGRKYAYVSLFGVESLHDLKIAISSSLDSKFFDEQKHLHDSFVRNVKSGLASIKEARITSNGMNVSTKLLEAFLFYQVKDAIICIDDFERLSNKLDIKDVMGLVNYLKLERNCQVVLLLDDNKAENENKNKYAEYKEKIVDENIKLKSVVPVLKDFIGDLDKEIQEFLVKFAETMEIHNFRFYQKVIKLYKRFLSILPDQIALSTKKIILTRVLQGYMIDDLPHLELRWEDFIDISLKVRDSWNANQQKQYKLLEKISYSFFYKDKWLKEFIDWFEQKENLAEDTLKNLAQSELITDQINQAKDNVQKILTSWRNLEVDSHFAENLFENSKIIISSETLNNLDFFHQLLIDFRRNDLAELFNLEVREYIDKNLEEDFFFMEFNEKNYFHQYAKSKKLEIPLLGVETLSEIIYSYVAFNGRNVSDKERLKLTTVQDWYNLFFQEMNRDEKLKELKIQVILREIFKKNIVDDPDLNAKIRADILSALEIKAQESELSSLNVESLKRVLEI